MSPSGKRIADPDEGLELCLRLSRAHAAVTRRLDNTLSSLHGLSFADFTILYYLERAPGAKLRRVDLAERVGLTPSGVTRSLLPLEKLGWVARQPDPRDARVGHATLTGSGRRLLGHAADSVRAVAQEVVDSGAAGRVDELSVLLARLAGLASSNG